MTDMNRRDAVKAAGLLLGGVAIASSGVALTGCSQDKPVARAPDTPAAPPRPMLLSAADVALMASVADTLLPDTYASPGAKAAGCAAEINLLVTDCFDAASQQRVVAALAAMRARAPQFETTLQPDREALLRTIDAEARKAGDTHWFHQLRELSLQSYFSSEVGITKALRYVREPGRYTGCVPLQAGQPAWA
ncbi:MAG TPA: gluconate 2-dehydrogenase subunit 3 family protein [Gemmatimonadaceae bacterium]|nr:gluconate 2-dehydrogenase subunit 3 family protein [Gemmatimonadaceae bacterium]